MFVAVGQNGLRMTSKDGASWQHIQTGKVGEMFRAIAYGRERFAAVGSYGGDNITAVSKDGQTWELGKIEARYTKYFRGLGFGKDFFLGLGGDPGSVGASKPFVMTSTDGQKWSEIQSIPGKHILRRVAWGNDRFVAVGDRGRRATSPDGLAWEDVADAKAIDTLVDVAFGQGKFVGVGLHGLRSMSEDGLKWTEAIRGHEGEHLNTILWTGDAFVAIGAGATFRSSDGVDWERSPNKDAPTTAAFGDGLFVGSLWKGRIVVSTDGVVWKEVHKSELHIESIAYGNV